MRARSAAARSPVTWIERGWLPVGQTFCRAAGTRRLLPCGRRRCLAPVTTPRVPPAGAPAFARTFGPLLSKVSVVTPSDWSKLFICFAIAVLLGGCASQRRTTTAELLNRLGTPTSVEAHTSGVPKSPLTGKFYVSYSPDAFAEPPDIRSARNSFISSMLATQLARNGMQFTSDLEDSDFVIWYSYFVVPGFNYWSYVPGYENLGPGWTHSFTIIISKNQVGPSVGISDPKNAEVWSANAEIPYWPDNDITESLPTMIAKIGEKLPTSPSSSASHN